MNRIDIKTKYALKNHDWLNDRLATDKTFDTREDAERYKREQFILADVAEVAVLEGELKPCACKAYPIAVTAIKYRDSNGKIWDREADCETSNAVISLNKAIGEGVFSLKDRDGWRSVGKKTGVFEFDITEQSQIDALWVIYRGYCKFKPDRKLLLDYGRSGYGHCDEIGKQRNRPKWINKLNNIQKLFDRTGSVPCRIRHRPYVAYYRGEEYDEFEEALEVRLGKKGVEYVRKDVNDKTCRTCKFRGTDCGYSVKPGSEPRCRVEAEEEDAKARPDVYSDVFEERDVYDWNDLERFDFDPDEALNQAKT